MSQTEVRTFKAATMQEALEVVRREMGPDAVILHTREVTPPRFKFWARTDQKVEITAGTGVNVRTPRAMQNVPPPAAPAQPRASVQPVANRMGLDSSMIADVYKPRGGTQPRPAPQELAPPPALIPDHSRANGYAAGHARPAPSNRPVETSRPSESAGTPHSFRPRTAVTREEQPRYSVANMHASAPTPHPHPGAQNEQQAAIERQLKSIQAMVEKLSHGSLSRAEDIPSELFQLYTELIDVDVDEDLARNLICRLKSENATEQLPASLAKSRLSQMVEGDIRCARPIAATAGQRRVVALVGPTGVGKTTTIAKLAANFRLRDGIRMGLVTVDTYRIAAVEQLRTYAEIIDLPMKVVTSPQEMRRALDELRGLDLVLIDTAGRSPRDELKIQELKNLLAEAQVDEVHLVMSLVASARSLQATAEQFAAVGTTAMILTKLDEAVGMGSLMSVAKKIPLPISYMTTGQDVPDDIEHASARRMSRLILGEESLFARRRTGSLS